MAGRRAYGEYLAWQAAQGPAGKNAAYASLSKGWAIGSDGFKAALVKEYDLAPLARAWEVDGAREVSRARWQDALHVALRRLGKHESDARAERKSAPWKIAIAAHLKRSTQANNRWLTELLHMGTAAAVSQYVSAFRHSQSPDQSLIEFFTEKLTA